MAGRNNEQIIFVSAVARAPREAPPKTQNAGEPALSDWNVWYSLGDSNPCYRRERIANTLQRRALQRMERGEIMPLEAAKIVRQSTAEEIE